MPDVNDILAELSEDEETEVVVGEEAEQVEVGVDFDFDVKMYAIENISMDNENREATEKAVDELAESIKQNGLIVPIIIDENNNLIDGERRLRACVKLGVVDIPAIVRTGKKQVGSVITNVQRENFTKEYLQKRFKKELKKRGMTQEKLADKYGMTQGRVSQIVGKRKKVTKEKQETKKKATGLIGVKNKVVVEVAKNINLIIGKKEVKIVFELSNEDLEQPKTALRKLVTEVDFAVVEQVRQDVPDIK